MNDYRPRLRRHLVLEGPDLVDPVAGRSVTLPPLAAELAPRLAGTRAWEALRAELLAAGHAEADADAALRALLVLHAVEGAGDATTARVARVSSGEEALPLSILAGARFACQGSGECCQNYLFGPLDQADVQRLARLDLAAAFPEAAPPYLEEIDGWPFLRSVDDRCVFLLPDQRCGLHAAFGADAKPRLCRFYPLDVLPTIEGLRLVDAGSCATFATSARAGLPLLEDLDRLRPLLPRALGLHHPFANVAGVPCDYGPFLAFTDVAGTLVRRQLGTAADTLLALGRGLAELAQALAGCPLEPGQPDAVVAAVLEGDPARWYANPSLDAARAGAAALADLCRAVLHTLLGSIGGRVAQKGHMTARLSREATQLLHLTIHDAALQAGEAPPLDDFYARVVAIPARAPDLDAVLRLSLRQQLFGGRALVELHAAAGLMRMALMQILALHGARLAAVAEDRSEARAEDLSHGHMLAARILDLPSIRPELVRLGGSFLAVLEGLPGLARLVPSS